jgi:flavin reductase (DIM6/NTAB) family NADH-FMN oxidoreductase RutF
VIHDDNPFADASDSRDPVRRFRGRLNAPVTICTSGDSDKRTGLTVSSLMVVEGDPGQVQAVVGPTTDLWDVVADMGRFVVHVCGERHRSLAEVFAGLRPSPGGIFTDLSVTDSEWGPVIDDLPDRAYCSLSSRLEVGFSGVVTARIDHVEVADLTNPLAYFRGQYHTLG